mmetsp:Transcript_45253/g.139597  ORF Transcript_45253/g.139597 Transcript_45253/m.139597 type:complete len:219 (-) Transcript_45253:1942-2598(-)
MRARASSTRSSIAATSISNLMLDAWTIDSSESVAIIFFVLPLMPYWYPLTFLARASVKSRPLRAWRRNRLDSSVISSKIKSFSMIFSLTRASRSSSTCCFLASSTRSSEAGCSAAMESEPLSAGCDARFVESPTLPMRRQRDAFVGSVRSASRVSAFHRSSSKRIIKSASSSSMSRTCGSTFWQRSMSRSRSASSIAVFRMSSSRWFNWTMPCFKMLS